MDATFQPQSPRLLLEFVSEFPAPPVERLQHENFGLLSQYLKSWTRLFGEPNHREDGDFEHFVENMARYDAAGLAFGYGNTTVMNHAGEHLVSHFQLLDGAPILPGEETEPDFVFGPVAKWGHGHQYRSEGSDIADRYWDIPAFRQLSGRRWELAGFYPDDPNARDLLEVLQDLFDDGVRSFVVKGTEPKTMLVKFDLAQRPVSLYGDEVPSEITDGVMHREGHSNVFLVQERIPMVHEYRCFMAGPVPASGAGCIEEFTPLDGHGDAFDIRVEDVRGSGTVANNDAMVRALKDFAGYAGALLYGQAPQLGHAWVMDVALNSSTGEFVVIELNPPRNAGLYASSPQAWMAAVRGHIMATKTSASSH